VSSIVERIAMHIPIPRPSGEIYNLGRELNDSSAYGVPRLLEHFFRVGVHALGAASQGDANFIRTVVGLNHKHERYQATQDRLPRNAEDIAMIGTSLINIAMHRHPLTQRLTPIQPTDYYVQANGKEEPPTAVLLSELPGSAYRLVATSMTQYRDHKGPAKHANSFSVLVGSANDVEHQYVDLSARTATARVGYPGMPHIPYDRQPDASPSTAFGAVNMLDITQNALAQ
jgi:hypothetical protein